MTAPIVPNRPGSPSRVIQGFFFAGQPRLPLPAAAPASRPIAPPRQARDPVQARTVLSAPGGRSGAVQPASRGAAPRSILPNANAGMSRLGAARPFAPGWPQPIPPNAPRAAAIQPLAASRPAAPQPILPNTARSAPVQPSGGNAFPLPPGFALQPSVLGQRLPEAVQQKMEAFFNTSFADVRVHVGPQAASIGALAFTHGTDLYFAPGRYDPNSAQGQQLLGHELSHVVQQRAGRVRNPLGAGVAVVQDPALEAEADRLGQRAAQSSMIQAKPLGDRSSPSTAGIPRLGPEPAGRLGNSATGPVRALAQAKLAPILPRRPSASPNGPQPSSAPSRPATGNRPPLSATLQPKVPGRPVPAAMARLLGAIQMVEWNRLERSAGGRYGIDPASRTNLYGQLDAPDPEPVGLYIKTQEKDTSNGSMWNRPRVNVWTPNVAFLNKAMGADAPRGRVTDVPADLGTLSDPAARQLLDRLKSKIISAQQRVNRQRGKNGATIGVVGMNDCESWALVLQKLIFQGRNSVNDPALGDATINQPDYNALPAAAVGDLISQTFGAGAASAGHGVTVVAHDDPTLVTLEAHVEKNLPKPAFHFYRETAGFFRTNNAGPGGPDEFLGVNRVVGRIKHLLSSSDYVLDGQIASAVDDMINDADHDMKLGGMRSKLTSWMVSRGPGQKARVKENGASLRRDDGAKTVMRVLNRGEEVRVLDEARVGSEFSLGRLSISKKHSWVRAGDDEGWLRQNAIEYTLT